MSGGNGDRDGGTGGGRKWRPADIVMVTLVGLFLALLAVVVVGSGGFLFHHPR
jgi:hypothetical protein